MQTKGKVLFTASIAKHILRFHIPYLKWFKERGYETHVACSGDEEIPYCDVVHRVPFVRSPYSLGHFRAFRMLKRVINAGNFQLVHCHTPMASVLTRLAAVRARKRGTKLLYSAHGFHFYRGAPLVNWMFYYPVELMLSYATDAIITINTEDFERVKSPGFNRMALFRVGGVGVDTKRFFRVSEDDKVTLRRKHGFGVDDFILIYVGEFIPRKNHEFIVRAVPVLKALVPKLKVVLPGRGGLLEKMIALAKELSVEDQVIFTGFRDDVNELMQLSDLGISASRQEGLGLNLAEEMACGLPIVASHDRGHRELVAHGVNGFLFAQNATSEFVDYVVKLADDAGLRSEFSASSLVRSREFSLDHSLEVMRRIYRSYIM